MNGQSSIWRESSDYQAKVWAQDAVLETHSYMDGQPALDTTPHCVALLLGDNQGGEDMNKKPSLAAIHAIDLILHHLANSTFADRHGIDIVEELAGYRRDMEEDVQQAIDGFVTERQS